MLGGYQSNNDSYEIRHARVQQFLSLGQGKTYYAGGFNGGKSEVFMKMAAQIADNVLIDQQEHMPEILDSYHTMLLDYYRRTDMDAW